MKLTANVHVIVDHDGFSGQYLIFNNGESEYFFESLVRILDAKRHGWGGGIEFFLFDKNKSTLAWHVGAVFITAEALGKYLAKQMRFGSSSYMQDDSFDEWYDGEEEFDAEESSDDELPF